MKMGKDGFVWFTGVIEDRADPLMLGRCKVRCLYYHPEDKNLVPTSALPWAHPMMPITSANMDGIGQSPIGPVEGTWVVGFFRDGHEAQDPVIMGTVGGIEEDFNNPKKGFNDPRDECKEDANIDHGPYPISINEPDTHVRARNESVDVKYRDWDKKKKKCVITETPHGPATRTPTRRITTALDKLGVCDAKIIFTKGKEAPEVEWISETFRHKNSDKDDWQCKDAGYVYEWSEPYDPYAAVYPKNHVFYTESGHLEEFDDTPGHERIYRKHKDGSFQEYFPGGDVVDKVVADKYILVDDNFNIYVHGDCNMTVDNTMSIKAKDFSIEVSNTFTQTVHNEMYTKVVNNKDTLVTVGDESTTVKTGDQYNTVSTGDQTNHLIIGNRLQWLQNKNKTKGDQTEIIGGNQIVTVSKAVDETYKKTQDTTVTGKVTKTYKSTSNTTVTGKVTETNKADLETNATLIELKKIV